MRVKEMSCVSHSVLKVLSLFFIPVISLSCSFFVSSLNHHDACRWGSSETWNTENHEVNDVTKMSSHLEKDLSKVLLPNVTSLEEGLILDSLVWSSIGASGLLETSCEVIPFLVVFPLQLLLLLLFSLILWSEHDVLNVSRNHECGSRIFTEGSWCLGW